MKDGDAALPAWLQALTETTLLVVVALLVATLLIGSRPVDPGPLDLPHPSPAQGPSPAPAAEATGRR